MGWRDLQSESIVGFERIPPLGLYNYDNWKTAGFYHGRFL